MNKKPKPKALKPVTFETAMGWLRRNKPIRRRAWHPESIIFRLGANVYVQLPKRAPDLWRPYAGDFLATDWMKA